MYNKRFCKEPEKIENYEKAKADNFIGWECHHRLETHTSDGKRRAVDITQAELIALGMYYNRPASELIFLPRSEHRLYQRGKRPSVGTRKKMRDSWDYDKHFTEEARRKMSEAGKGKPKSEEHKKKIGTANKGEKNPMYGKHLSEDHKNKLSEINKGNTNTKGMHWFNNGKINKVCYECPPGFVPGMLR